MSTPGVQLTANGGVDEFWMARLAELPPNLRLAPVVEVQAVVEGIGASPVYGVDLLPEGREGQADRRGGVALSSALARRLGITSAGAKLPLQIEDRTQEFTVARIFDAKDAEFALLDIADAQ